MTMAPRLRAIVLMSDERRRTFTEAVMFKGLTIGMMVAAISVLVVAAAATPVSAGNNDTFLVGRGVLDARGDGLVAVKGRVDVRLSADGGMLLVKDVAGDAVVRVRGNGRTASFEGFTVYFGLDGEAHITGSDVGVVGVGNNINLHAIGKGWAYLKGRGHYMVNNHGPFPWNPDGGFAAVEPPAEEN
jgi:hypothetical protein